MAETLGKTGTVLEVNAAGDVRVRLPSQRAYLFNPRVCVWMCVCVRCGSWVVCMHVWLVGNESTCRVSPPVTPDWKVNQ
jgi:hypothetical protein